MYDRRIQLEFNSIFHNSDEMAMWYNFLILVDVDYFKNVTVHTFKKVKNHKLIIGFWFIAVGW